MTTPSEDLVEQIARVAYAAFFDGKYDWETCDDEMRQTFLDTIGAVLASTPIKQYFRDLDHADRISAATVGESHPTGIGETVK